MQRVFLEHFVEDFWNYELLVQEYQEAGNTRMRKCDINQTVQKVVYSIHPDDLQWQEDFQTPTPENTLTPSLYLIKALTLSILFYLIYGEEKWGKSINELVLTFLSYPSCGNGNENPLSNQFHQKLSINSK